MTWSRQLSSTCLVRHGAWGAGFLRLRGPMQPPSPAIEGWRAGPGKLGAQRRPMGCGAKTHPTCRAALRATRAGPRSDLRGPISLALHRPTHNSWWRMPTASPATRQGGRPRCSPASTSALARGRRACLAERAHRPARWGVAHTADLASRLTTQGGAAQTRLRRAVVALLPSPLPTASSALARDELAFLTRRIERVLRRGATGVAELDRGRSGAQRPLTRALHRRCWIGIRNGGFACRVNLRLHLCSHKAPHEQADLP